MAERVHTYLELERARVRALKLIGWNIWATPGGRAAPFNRINTNDICLDRSNASTSGAPPPPPGFFLHLSHSGQGIFYKIPIFHLLYALTHTHIHSYTYTESPLNKNRMSVLSIESTKSLFGAINISGKRFVVAMRLGMAGFYSRFMYVVLDSGPQSSLLGISLLIVPLLASRFLSSSRLHFFLSFFVAKQHES